jgi:hypothetical protein
VAYRHTDVAAVNYLIEVICAEYLASVEVFPDEAKKKSVVDSLQLALSRASAELSDAR